jgi:hypothetical protein
MDKWDGGMTAFVIGCVLLCTALVLLVGSLVGRL